MKLFLSSNNNNNSNNKLSTIAGNEQENKFLATGYLINQFWLVTSPDTFTSAIHSHDQSLSSQVPVTGQFNTVKEFLNSLVIDIGYEHTDNSQPQPQLVPQNHETPVSDKRSVKLIIDNSDSSILTLPHTAGTTSKLPLALVKLDRPVRFR